MLHEKPADYKSLHMPVRITKMLRSSNFNQISKGNAIAASHKPLPRPRENPALESLSRLAQRVRSTQRNSPIATTNAAMLGMLTASKGGQVLSRPR